jgi:hypothetical protein
MTEASRMGRRCAIAAISSEEAAARQAGGRVPRLLAWGIGSPASLRFVQARPPTDLTLASEATHRAKRARIMEVARKAWDGQRDRSVLLFGCCLLIRRGEGVNAARP